MIATRNERSAATHNYYIDRIDPPINYPKRFYLSAIAIHFVVTNISSNLL